jgi:hypothetical protein
MSEENFMSSVSPVSSTVSPVSSTVSPVSSPQTVSYEGLSLILEEDNTADTTFDKSLYLDDIVSQIEPTNGIFDGASSTQEQPLVSSIFDIPASVQSTTNSNSFEVSDADVQRLEDSLETLITLSAEQQRHLDNMNNA